jgi:hypothetical protein
MLTLTCIDYTGGLFSSGKSAIKDKTNVFALGDRIETLRAHDAGVILVHIAEDEGVVSIYMSADLVLHLSLLTSCHTPEIPI